jgi:hypothetical protein
MAYQTLIEIVILIVTHLCSSLLTNVTMPPPGTVGVLGRQAFLITKTPGVPRETIQSAGQGSIRAVGSDKGRDLRFSVEW